LKLEKNKLALKVKSLKEQGKLIQKEISIEQRQNNKVEG